MTTALFFAPARPRLATPHATGDALADQIISAISLGSLAPGDRLPSEIDLARTFGVAVATLRKSLAVLRNDDIVETRRGREGGTFVVRVPFPSDAEVAGFLRDLSIIDIRDYGDELAAISRGIARLVVQRAPEQLLSDLCQRAEKLAELGDASVPTLATTDNRFFIQLGVLSQSPRLMRAEMRLRSEIASLKWSPAAAATSSTNALAEHRVIATVLSSRDAEQAERTLEDQIRQLTFRIIDAKLTNEANATKGDSN